MQNLSSRSVKSQHLFLCLALILLLGSCSEKELHPDDVEYRKDENGTTILYQLGMDKPFGNEKRAYIVDNHPNGKIHFKIGFVKGYKDGNFSFWQDNELKLLTGSFKKGKRNKCWDLTDLLDKFCITNLILENNRYFPQWKTY